MAAPSGIAGLPVGSLFKIVPVPSSQPGEGPTLYQIVPANTPTSQDQVKPFTYVNHNDYNEHDLALQPSSLVRVVDTAEDGDVVEAVGGLGNGILDKIAKDLKKASKTFLGFFGLADDDQSTEQHRSSIHEHPYYTNFYDPEDYDHQQYYLEQDTYGGHGEVQERVAYREPVISYFNPKESEVDIEPLTNNFDGGEQKDEVRTVQLTRTACTFFWPNCNALCVRASILRVAE